MTDTDMELRQDRAIREYGWCRACHSLLTSCKCHSRDEDCDVDPFNGCCRVCGVYHGQECMGCDGRGYHRNGCAIEERDSQSWNDNS